MISVERYGFHDKFIVRYVSNMGVTQGLEVLIVTTDPFRHQKGKFSVDGEWRRTVLAD